MTTKRGVATSTRRREEGRRTRGKGLVLMKMYRGRKSRAEWPLRIHLASVVVRAKYSPRGRHPFPPFNFALSFTTVSSSSTLFHLLPATAVSSLSLVLRREPMRIRDLRYIPSLKVVTRLVFQRERPYRGKAATATALSTIWHKSTQCSTLRELRPPLSPHCLPSFAFLSLFPFPSMTCSSRVGREAAIRTNLPIINSTCLFHPLRAICAT